MSLARREAKNLPFIVRVSSPPPSQSNPCQESVYLPVGGLIVIVVDEDAVFAFASVTVTLTVYVP